MSVEAEKLYDGITGIRDDIVERAEGFVFKKKKRAHHRWEAWGIMAACACLLVMITLPQLAGGGKSSDSSSFMTEGAMHEEAVVEDVAETPKEMRPTEETEMTAGDLKTQSAGSRPESGSTNGASAAQDTEKQSSLSDSMAQTDLGDSMAQMSDSAREEALSIGFEVLLPRLMLAGYELEDSVYLYENTVLQAKYYNEELQDELIIRVARREWFEEEYVELKLDTVLYHEKTDSVGSYFFVGGDALIAEYSFRSRDIAEIEDFYDMVYSATFFEE